jgi:hypothetical protein
VEARLQPAVDALVLKFGNSLRTARCGAAACSGREITPRPDELPLKFSFETKARLYPMQVTSWSRSATRRKNA